MGLLILLIAIAALATVTGHADTLLVLGPTIAVTVLVLGLAVWLDRPRPGRTLRATAQTVRAAWLWATARWWIATAPRPTTRTPPPPAPARAYDRTARATSRPHPRPHRRYRRPW
ncbi:hypothetical protein ACWEFL_15920 [Streptomyces sp. NPDC004838]